MFQIDCVKYDELKYKLPFKIFMKIKKKKTLPVEVVQGLAHDHLGETQESLTCLAFPSFWLNFVSRVSV